MTDVKMEDHPMRRTFALLLAAVMAAGTLTGPAMAAESQKEGTADSASQEVQDCLLYTSPSPRD